jgi:cell division protein FtsW
MLRPGQVLFLCALALLAIGVVMVNSAGMNVAPVDLAPVMEGPPAPQPDRGVVQSIGSVVFGRSTVYMALAVIAMAATSLVPVGRLARLVDSHGEGQGGGAFGILVLGLGCLGLLCVLATAYIPGLGAEINGARRWIKVPLPGLGNTSVQPSEIAKWGSVMLLAVYGASRPQHMKRFFGGLAPGLIAVAVVAAAVAHEDLGTGALIMAVACVVLLAAGARLWQFLMFVPAGAAALVALIVTNPYRLTRIETFLNPYADPQGSGYHVIQSMLAVAGGEGFGRGLGYGLQKFGYLLEDTSDFIFGIVCEELGIAGAAVVMFLYAMLLWSAFSIVRQQRSMTLKLTGLGVMCTIGLQALFNLAVVTGMAPTKGIALPLISSGGTGWIMTAASLGLLVAIDGLNEAEEAAAAVPAPAPDRARGGADDGVRGLEGALA